MAIAAAGRPMLKKNSKYYDMTRGDQVGLTGTLKMADTAADLGIFQKALEIKEDFDSLQGEVNKQINNMQCMASEGMTEFEKYIGFDQQPSRPKVKALDPEDYEPIEWFGNTTYAEYLNEYL